MPQFSRLEGDCKTDVLIIGGGIAGILCAYRLWQMGVPYILVEKECLCCGTTQNTTAKISVAHGLIYNKLLQKHGKEYAQMYLNANKSAFDIYRNLCSDIECDWQFKDSFVYSTTNRQKLEDEVSALEKLGEKVSFCETLSIPVDTVGAVRYPNQAQFHPIKFLSQISRNLNIYENTFVREMIGTTAVTNCGKIHAKKVIAATHFPFINKHGAYFLKLYQHRSYILALENACTVDGIYVDESKKGMTFRNHNDLLIIGGGAHRTGKQGGNWNELREFARKNYPNAKEKYHWAAQDCMSLDDIAYIGHYSKNTPDFYVTSGFNKWGITGAMVGAMIICDDICGIKNDFAPLFNPSRSILKPQLLLNGFEATKNLLTPSTKRCPHLGCALKWNSAEHSWDCACHGSRFDKNGRVLDNPANDDLRM